MKVAWVSTYDSADPLAYQGRGYYAPISLENQSILVEHLGPLQISAPVRLVRKLAETKHLMLHDNQFIKPENRRWYSRENMPLVVRDYAHHISQKLSKLSNVDIVFSGVSSGSQPISYLDCKQPIVIWTDTTMASAIDFYPQYFRNKICQKSINDIISNERAAINRSKLLIYSSEWGARNAIDQYKIDPGKVKVVPFGANLECNRNLDDIKRLIEVRQKSKCKLLFVGVDWLRKGGDIAYRITQELNALGIPAELSVVGCAPLIDEPIPGFVKSFGYISSATKEGSEMLNKLFEESHFFIMPSRAESFGYVYCEASSYGVPSIASNVGGIPTAVKDNVNGKTFSINAAIKEYCDYISSLYFDHAKYKELALSSFNEYETRLNWAVAGKHVKQLISELIS